MRIQDLVKTYRIINDPDAPPWSVKFVGALVVLAAALGIAVAAWSTGGEAVAPANAMLTTSEASGDGTRVDYVGYAPGSFDPLMGYEASRAGDALATWKAQHPSAKILDVEPVQQDGRLLGYKVHWRS